MAEVLGATSKMRTDGVNGSKSSHSGSRNHWFWRATTVPKMLSSCQVLFNRELGMSTFSRSTDTSCNWVHERQLSLNLIKARSPTEGLPATGVLVELKENNDGRRKNLKKISWQKIATKKKSRILMEEGIIIEDTTLERKKHAIQYFVPHPDVVRGFQSIGKSTYTGRKEEYDVVGGRALTSVKSRFSTYLTSLTDNGMIHMFDITNGTCYDIPLGFYVSRMTNLQMTDEQRCRFTVLHSDTMSGELIVLATAAGYVKIIFRLAYPPFYPVDVIYVNAILKMETFGNLFVLVSPNKIELTTWENILKATVLKSGKNRTKGSDKFLNYKPEILCSFNTKNGYFGIMDHVYPPLYKFQTDNHIKLACFETDTVIWEHYVGRQDESEILPMPDTLKCFMRINNTYAICDLKSREGTTEVSESHPFDVIEETNETPVSISNRPRRISANKIVEKRRTEVLGLNFCMDLGLAVVCTADGPNINVRLYECRTLDLFIALQPFCAWPKKRSGRRRQRGSDGDSDDEDFEDSTDLISNFEVELFPEFVGICIGYGQGKFDAYILRLMCEQPPANPL